MSEHDGPTDGEPEVGSLGEEAAKLLGALGSWAREREEPPAGTHDPGPDPGDDSGHYSRDDPGHESAGTAGGAARPGADGGPAWGASLGALAGSAASFAAEVNAHIATGQDECRWCPVCRTVHAVRQASPEVRTQLRAATTHALQAALAFMSTLPPPDAAARRGPDLERIDLEPDEPDEPDEPGAPGAPAPTENPEEPR